MNAATQTNPIGSTSLARWLYYPWLAFGSVGLFYCFQYLLRVSPGLIQKDFILNYGQHSLRITQLTLFYYYLYVPLQLLVGVLLDYLPVRKMLVLANLACVLGICLFTIADSSWEVELGRLSVILGSSFAFVGSLKIASLYFPENRFAMLVGLAAAFGMLGGMIGQALLPIFMRFSASHAMHFFIAAIGLSIAIMMSYALRSENVARREQPLNFKALSYAISKNIVNPQILLIGLVGGLLFLPSLSFTEIWGRPYLEQVYNFSSADASKAISLVFLGWLVSGPAIGWLSDKMQLRVLPLTAGAMLSAIFISAVLYLPNLTHPLLLILLFGLGACSSAQVTVFAIAREISSENTVGVRLAIVNMLVMVSGIISLPIVNMFVKVQFSQRWYYYFTDNHYQLALVIVPLGLILAAFLTFFITEKYTSFQSDRS